MQMLGFDGYDHEQETEQTRSQVQEPTKRMIMEFGDADKDKAEKDLEALFRGRRLTMVPMKDQTRMMIYKGEDYSKNGQYEVYTTSNMENLGELLGSTVGEVAEKWNIHLGVEKEQIIQQILLHGGVDDLLKDHLLGKSDVGLRARGNLVTQIHCVLKSFQIAMANKNMGRIIKPDGSIDR